MRTIWSQQIVIYLNQIAGTIFKQNHEKSYQQMNSLSAKMRADISFDYTFAKKLLYSFLREKKKKMVLQNDVIPVSFLMGLENYITIPLN